VGANSTQAVAVLIMLIAFVLLAGAWAGGTILLMLAALVFLGVSGFFFMKCKPWEDQND
jgi:hypothetical protein